MIAWRFTTMRMLSLRALLSLRAWSTCSKLEAHHGETLHASFLEANLVSQLPPDAAKLVTTSLYGSTYNGKTHAVLALNSMSASATPSAL